MWNSGNWTPREQLKLSEVQTYDVTLQAGTPYRQLVLRDDRPLLATEEKKERESLARSIAERRQETAAERAERLSVYERRPDWQRAVWHELPDAFDFRVVGEEVLDGRSLLVIEGVAHARDIKPRSCDRQVVPLAESHILGGPTRRTRS